LDVVAAVSPRLILASASPRRQQLLREAGYPFVVSPADIDESVHPPGLTPGEVAEFLAASKARTVSVKHPQDVVLAADTVVALGEQMLGKPIDADDARRMLHTLGGSTHYVITGVAVMCGVDNRLRQARVTSSVHMRPLSEPEIEAYIASNEWQGKAGGYGIQDRDPFVTRTSGCHTNIVGLPMTHTATLLAEFQIVPQKR
jgi:septum formation protein